MVKKIQITFSVAIHLLERIAVLFREAAGEHISDNYTDDTDMPGLIDEYSPDTPVHTWMNSVLGLLRLMYGILYNSVDEVYLLPDEEDKID